MSHSFDPIQFSRRAHATIALRAIDVPTAPQQMRIPVYALRRVMAGFEPRGWGVSGDRFWCDRVDDSLGRCIPMPEPAEGSW